MHFAMLLNATPNVKTAPYSPQYIVEGKRSAFIKYRWEAAAIFHHVRKDKGTRVDVGLIVGYDNFEMTRIRVYLPLTDRVAVRGQPQMIYPDIPPEFGFLPKHKIRSNIIEQKRAIYNGEALAANYNYAVQRETPRSSLNDSELFQCANTLPYTINNEHNSKYLNDLQITESINDNANDDDNDENNNDEKTEGVITKFHRRKKVIRTT